MQYSIISHFSDAILTVTAKRKVISLLSKKIMWYLLYESMFWFQVIYSFVVHQHCIAQVKSLCLFFKYSQYKQSPKYTWRESFEDVLKEISDITRHKNSNLLQADFSRNIYSLIMHVIKTLLILNAVNLKWMEQCCSSCKWLWFM